MCVVRLCAGVCVWSGCVLGSVCGQAVCWGLCVVCLVRFELLDGDELCQGSSSSVTSQPARLSSSVEPLIVKKR